MNTINLSISKKIFRGLVILIACISLTVAHYANAQTATLDATNLVQNTATAAATAASETSNAATAASTAADAASNAANQATNLASYSWTSYGKNLLDAAAYQMAQNLLTKLTDNTVKWIKGGFHGSPNFAVDLKQAAVETADNIAGGLVLSLRNIAVCDFTANYKDDLLKAVELSPKQRQYTYNQKAVCPFNQNYTYRASDFYADFNKGGWSMMNAALSDGGNPYGVQMLTAQEQTSREADAKRISDQKLNWSNGFSDIIDVTDCNYPADIFYYAGDQATDTDPDGISADEAAAKNVETFSDPARVAALQKAYCNTTTPGKIVGDQLTKTLGVNMDRIGFADNMNKIVAAFINVAMEQTVRGVFGKGDRSTGPGGKPTTSTSVTLPPLNISTFAAGNITPTTAQLNGGLIYAGTGVQRVRVWFVWRNADTTIPGIKLFEIAPINTKPLQQNISINATDLTPGNTYMVNTALTTNGADLILPYTTSSVINGQTVTRTNPGNGTFGTEVSFSTPL